jgi:uncharacterized protein DUF3631/bifunctional DNA primase/polymerase-like protein/primase-like protein
VSPNLTAAFSYSRSGWHVLPLHTPVPGGCSCVKPDCQRPGKHPRTLHGLNDATTDEAIIRKWWTCWPDANIGIVVPDGMVVVDIDGEEGETALRDAGYELSPTVTCKTGRGTHHYYRTLAKVGPKIGVLPHIDLRGPGSYVIAPPSLHARGNLYTWIVSPTERKPADVPEWLPRLTAQPERGDGGSVETRAILREGERNDGLFRLGASLRARGLSSKAIEAALLAENLARCSPPLPDVEVRVIAGSASKYPAGTGQGVTPPGPATRKLEVGEADALVREAGLLDLGDKPSPDEVAAALWRLVEIPHLRNLDALGRQAVRARATEVLQTANATRSTAMVQAAFASLEEAERAGAGQGKGPRLQGSPLVFTDPEPWPEAVNGEKLLAEIRDRIAGYAAMPPTTVVAAALYVMFTYCSDAFCVCPLLAVKSATKRCGKTTLITVLARLVRRALLTSNITPAALFRIIEKDSPTVLVDEADTFFALSDEVRRLINAGHTRSTANLTLTVGDDHEPRTFSTWAPKILALIGNPPDTVEDRSVSLVMKRRTRKEKVQRLRLDRLDEEMAPLRRKLARWALDHLEALRGLDPDVPEALHDRAADNWRPLLAIAELCGGDCPGLAREAAVSLAGSVEEAEESHKVRLLSDIRDHFERMRTDRAATEDLLKALNALDEAPWLTWSRGKPLCARGLARLLKPFGISSGTIRIGEETAKGYKLVQFEGEFERYFPQAFTADSDKDAPPPEAPLIESVTTSQSLSGAGYNPYFDPSRPPLVTDGESSLSGNGINDVTEVTDSNGESGASRCVKPSEPEHPDGTDLLVPSSAASKLCSACKQSRWWISIHGARVCGVCHPPASEPPEGLLRSLRGHHPQAGLAHRDHGRHAPGVRENHAPGHHRREEARYDPWRCDREYLSQGRRPGGQGGED